MFPDHIEIGEYLSSDVKAALFDLIYERVTQKLKEERETSLSQGERVARGRLPTTKKVASILGIKTSTVKAWKARKWKPNMPNADLLFKKAWELDSIETQKVIAKDRRRADLFFGFTMSVNQEPACRINFYETINGKTASISFREIDFVPVARSKWLVNVCGSEINPNCAIHTNTDAYKIVDSYYELCNVTKASDLMPPLVILDYIQFHKGFTPITPSWAGLLKLAFWYTRCQGQRIEYIEIKETELKEKLYGLANKEKKRRKDAKYLSYIEEIQKQILSIKNEFMNASLLRDIVSDVRFGKHTDLVVNSIPTEVKTLTTKAYIDKSSENPVLELDGIKLDNGVSLIDAFVEGLETTMKRGKHHFVRANEKNAKLVLLNASATFLGILMGSVPGLGISEMSLEKATRQVLPALEKDAAMGIIVIAEISGYHHTISALPISLGCARAYPRFFRKK